MNATPNPHKNAGQACTFCTGVEEREPLCGYALGCRAEAEWMTGTSPRCSLHRAMLDADPDRQRLVARHPGLAWKPIVRAVATMAVPLLLFVLLPGCGESKDAPSAAYLLAIPAFALGFLVCAWTIRLLERTPEDPEATRACDGICCSLDSTEDSER